VTDFHSQTLTKFSIKKQVLKKPFLPEKPVKKPAFCLPADFVNETWAFSTPAPDKKKQAKLFKLRRSTHQMLGLLAWSRF
jgi:hypothetical protein